LPTIKFQSKCRFCNKNIVWEGLYRVGRPDEPATESQYELVSTGFQNTTQGNRIAAEATVTCPVCQNRNRYEIEFVLNLQ
jgi:endogenous inhibitor of DNA gyrase (YacG/DUF329 family)